MDNTYNVTINAANAIDESVVAYWKKLKVEYDDTLHMGDEVVCGVAGMLVVGSVIWAHGGAACVYVTEPLKLTGVADYLNYRLLHHRHFAVPIEETIAVTR